MPSTPLWLTGHRLTLMEVVVQTLNTTTGALADSTALDAATLADGSIIGLVDGIEFAAGRTTENISSVTQFSANNVRLTRRDQITVTEILRTGVGKSLLANVWTSPTSRYVRVKFTRGGNSWQFYGLLQAYEESLRRGKSTGRLTVQMVDVGQNNAAFS